MSSAGTRSVFNWRVAAVLVVAVGAVLVQRAAAAQCGKATESGSVALSCAVPGQLITSVIFSSYGTPTGGCATGMALSSCHSSLSTSVVESLCLGRSGCTVPASNDYFGDPCGGTVKALAIQVQCARQPQSITCARVGENAEMKLSCPPHSQISSVSFASYGTPTGACPALATGACHASTSQSVVEGLCVGKSSCVIKAQNSVFGDPCGGTYKILDVQLQCKSLVTPIFGYATEGSTLTLSCPSSSTSIVEVGFASYGTPSAVGPLSQGTFSLGDCHAGSSQNIVAKACGGKSSCTLAATNELFGEPCQNTFKQLAVRLHCA